MRFRSARIRMNALRSMAPSSLGSKSLQIALKSSSESRTLESDNPWRSSEWLMLPLPALSTSWKSVRGRRRRPSRRLMNHIHAASPRSRCSAAASVPATATAEPLLFDAVGFVRFLHSWRFSHLARSCSTSWAGRRRSSASARYCSSALKGGRRGNTKCRAGTSASHPSLVLTTYQFTSVALGLAVGLAASRLFATHTTVSRSVVDTRRIRNFVTEAPGAPTTATAAAHVSAASGVGASPSNDDDAGRTAGDSVGAKRSRFSSIASSTGEPGAKILILSCSLFNLEAHAAKAA
mmetsp:Transcript_79700/g.159146  ORF Transcript_79700/g.159146 Transcript_79700/m.159146 type:complete len:293 (-) Transcript_79700:234-1112(-)